MRRANARRSALALGALVFTLAGLGCARLPTLSEGACGNFVVEAGEDCDGHAPGGAKCASAAPNECRFVCGPAEADPDCPAGYGCGADQVCRRASGTLALTGDPVGFTWPRSLRTGDFNLDGAPDLLMLGAPDAAGLRPARVLVSEGFHMSEALTELPVEIAAPAVGAGTGGELRDIAFADREGVAILRGHQGDVAHFMMVPSIVLREGTSARLLFVDTLPEVPGDEIVVLIDSAASGASLVGVSNAGGASPMLTPMPGGEADLIGTAPLLAAAFDETLPCKQVVVSYDGATTVPVFSPCRMGPLGAEWNEGGEPLAVKLVPPAPIDRGVFVADVDMDGHHDLVVGAGGQTYVAFGLGNGEFVAKNSSGNLNEAAPYMLPEAAGDAGFPLAMADLNADGAVDFVVPRGVVISRPSGYELAYGNLGFSWSEAVIGYFNGNDRPDVVASAAGVVDLDFLNNAGGGVFAPAVISTHGPARLLTTGDFDGDSLGDLVFSEQIGENGVVVDHLAWSFGVPFGAPTRAVTVVDAGVVEQLTTGHFVGQTGVDAMAEVAAVFEAEAHKSDALTVLQGRTSRNLFPALPLRGNFDTFLPISLAFGHFGDETADVAALGVDRATGELRLFRVEAFEDGPPGLPEASEALDEKFSRVEPEGSGLFRHGALLATANVSGDEVENFDEVIVVGAYESKEGAALMIADYDEEEATFTSRAAVPFTAELTIDSELVVTDVDGDGHMDALVSTGSHAAPGGLVILWGEAGDIGKKEPTTLDPDGSGVRAFACVTSPSGKGVEVLVAGDDALYRYTFDEGRSPVAVPIPISLHARVVALAAADFDRDGVEDLAVQGEDGFELYRSIPEIQ